MHKKIGRPKLKVCKRGHETEIYGRDPDNHCSECRRLRCRKYREDNLEKELKRSKKYRKEHTEQWQRWYLANKERIQKLKKKYNREHPEIIKAILLRNHAKRSLRIVAWTDWNKIKEVYKNQPANMEVDHIIPLCGRKVAGLHVSWNLQYLSRLENCTKRNCIDLLWASEWYGKILEADGLKEKS